MSIGSTVPPERRLVEIPGPAYEALVRAQGECEMAQIKRDALLTGLVTAQGIRAGRVVEVIDGPPHQLVIALPPDDSVAQPTSTTERES